MDPLLLHNLLETCIDYFENIWSTELHRSSKYWYISYNIENHILTITNDQIREVFKNWKAVKLTVVDTINVQNSNFCLKVLTLSLAIYAVSCFP